MDGAVVGAGRPGLAWVWGTLLCGGCLLRLTGLEVHSFWYDEVQAAWLATVPDLFLELRGDRHPPLFFLALQQWAAWFGTSDAVLRALPALTGCASLLVFARVTPRVLPPRAAMLAVAAFAFAPFQVWYAQELRMYAQLELGSLLALLGAVSQQMPVAGRGALLFVGTALAMGSHYFGFLVPAFVLPLLFDRTRAGGTGSRTCFLLALAAVLGIVVWLPWLLAFVPDQLRAPWGFAARTSLRELAELPVRMFVTTGRALPAWLPLALGFCVGLGLLGALGDLRQRSGPTRRLAVSLGCTVAALLAAFVFLPPNLQPMYLIGVSPVFVMLLAQGLARLPARIPIGWIWVLLLALATLGVRQQNHKEDYRHVVAEIAAAFQRGDLVVAVTGTPEGPSQAGLRHYLRERPDVLAAIRALPGLTAELEAGTLGPTRIHVLHRDRGYAQPSLERLLARVQVVEATVPREIVRRLLVHSPR